MTVGLTIYFQILAHHAPDALDELYNRGGAVDMAKRIPAGELVEQWAFVGHVPSSQLEHFEQSWQSGFNRPKLLSGAAFRAIEADILVTGESGVLDTLIAKRAPACINCGPKGGR